jgi:hypothetical protein
MLVHVRDCLFLGIYRLNEIALRYDPRDVVLEKTRILITGL